MGFNVVVGLHRICKEGKRPFSFTFFLPYAYAVLPFIIKNKNYINTFHPKWSYLDLEGILPQLLIYLIDNDKEDCIFNLFPLMCLVDLELLCS